MNSQHSTTNIKQFVATTFAVNRVKMFLPVKVTVDSNDKKKVLNSKSSLNFNNFSELHSNGETTDANGNKYSLTNQYGITYSNCTHFELSLRANTNVFCILTIKTLHLIICRHFYIPFHIPYQALKCYHISIFK